MVRTRKKTFKVVRKGTWGLNMVGTRKFILGVHPQWIWLETPKVIELALSNL
uniref:Uncharacterized protein n=1 Tax=Helianthus annuus TaxID=4232 RepID=A0A251UC75_HELAN